MTDTPPPKRRFWQIHLSTAVVLVLLSAAIIWANVTPRVTQHSVLHVDNNYDLEWAHSFSASVGWPSAMWEGNATTYLASPEDSALQHRLQKIAWRTIFDDDGPGRRSIQKVILNGALAFIVLLTTAINIEYLIHRRSKP